jgi:hypothetical protein
VERNVVTLTGEHQRQYTDVSSKSTAFGFTETPCIACTDRWTESSNFGAAVSECAYCLASRPVFGDIN